MVKSGEIYGWIVFDGDKIGEQAFFYTADTILHMENFRVHRGGCFQSIKCRHSECTEKFDLASFIAVRENADIAAAADGYTGIESELEYGFLSFIVRPADG